MSHFILKWESHQNCDANHKGTITGKLQAGITVALCGRQPGTSAQISSGGSDILLVLLMMFCNSLPGFCSPVGEL